LPECTTAKIIRQFPQNIWISLNIFLSQNARFFRTRVNPRTPTIFDSLPKILTGKAQSGDEYNFDLSTTCARRIIRVGCRQGQRRRVVDPQEKPGRGQRWY